MAVDPAFLKYIDAAHPFNWLRVADELHDQLKLVRARTGSSHLILNVPGKASQTWDANNRTVYLLGGFVLENAIKGFLVFENPSWICNGKLSPTLKSHKLRELAGMSKELPHKVRGMRTLKVFEEGLESWARYPCGLHSSNVEHPGRFCDRDWRSYLWLTEAYGKKLGRLLERGWTGPHQSGMSRAVSTPHLLQRS